MEFATIKPLHTCRLFKKNFFRQVWVQLCADLTGILEEKRQDSVSKKKKTPYCIKEKSASGSETVDVYSI